MRTLRAKCLKSSLERIRPTSHVSLKYGFKWRTISPEISVRKRSLIFFAAELCASIGSLDKSLVFFFLATGFGDLQRKSFGKTVEDALLFEFIGQRNTYDFRGGIVIDFLCFVSGTVGLATMSLVSSGATALIGFIEFFAINSLVSDTNL